MRNSSETKDKNEDIAAAFGIWDCGSPLYDSYELTSLSHLIERHLMKLPSLGGSMRLTTRFSHHSDVTTTTISDSTSNAKAQESSSAMSCSLGDFLGSKFWKRRRFGQRREKPKKLRTVLLCFGIDKAGFPKK